MDIYLFVGDFTQALMIDPHNDSIKLSNVSRKQLLGVLSIT